MKPITLTLCSCNKYLDKNMWKPYSNIEKLITDKIRKQIPKAEVFFKNFEMPMAWNEKKEVEVIVRKEKSKKAKVEEKRAGETKDKEKDKEQVVKVVLKLSKCDRCSREGTQYYEAILQVRSLNPEVVEKGVGVLKRRVENLREKGVFINKAEQVTDGFDLYITDKRAAQALGKQLYEEFGGVFKASPRLFTKNRQSGKNIYRMNILVRLPDFVTGDVIINHDRVFRVEKTGAKIKLFDFEKNCYTTTDFSKMHSHVLKKHSTYVSRTQPYLEVINPFDFQSSLVKNKPEQKFELGQEVKIVVHKGIYVVD